MGYSLRCTGGYALRCTRLVGYGEPEGLEDALTLLDGMLRDGLGEPEIDELFAFGYVG